MFGFFVGRFVLISSVFPYLPVYYSQEFYKRKRQSTDLQPGFKCTEGLWWKLTWLTLSFLTAFSALNTSYQRLPDPRVPHRDNPQPVGPLAVSAHTDGEENSQFSHISRGFLVQKTWEGSKAADSWDKISVRNISKPKDTMPYLTRK